MPDRSLSSSAALNQQTSTNQTAQEENLSNKENLNNHISFNSPKTLTVGYCTRNVSTTASLNGSF
jgi:hypothetical protein